MSYSCELEKKKLVIRAGNLLSEKGLVERTWGNVSIRIDGEHFAVSPSGASYVDLKPEDIPIINLKDFTFLGGKKPSSELMIHSYLYNAYPNVSFVLHTHQRFASLLGLSLAMKNIKVGEKYKNILGNNIPIAEYAEAGTKKIAENILKASSSSTPIVLMASHGVVCFATSFDEAFNIVQTLEDFAKELVLNKLKKVGVFLESYGKLHTYTKNDFLDDEKNATTNKLCSLIFKELPDISFITLSTLPISKYISTKLEIQNFPYITESFKGIPIYFDDAAQIIGEGAIFISNTKDIDLLKNNSKMLFEKCNALVVSMVGVLFFSQQKDETIYMSSIFEKNALAFLLSLHNPNIATLTKENANLLHTSFIQGYSKLRNT